MKHILTLVLVLMVGMVYGAPTSPTTPSKPAATPTKPGVTPAKPVPEPKPAPALKPTPAPAKPVPKIPEVKTQKVEPPYLGPGKLSVQSGIATSLGTLSGIGRIGVEYGLGSFQLADIAFFWGTSGHLDYGYFSAERPAYRVSDSGVGLALMGTLHFNWKALFPAVPVVKDLDSSLELGASYYSLGRSFQYSGGSLVNGGTRTGPGVTAALVTHWFFLPNFAARFEGGYYGYYSAGGIGVLYQL